jgi:hypothetical protein
MPDRKQQHRAQSQAPSAEQIAERAYERWLERGCTPGDDQHDWFAAEAELLIAAQPKRTSPLQRLRSALRRLNA